MELTREERSAGARVYDFTHVGDWRDIGLQDLLSSGLRPECVTIEEFSVLRAQPLRTSSEFPFVFGSPHAVRCSGVSDVEYYENTMSTATDVIRVEARAFSEDGVGFVRASLWYLAGEARVEGWVVVTDDGKWPPVYLGAASALTALRMV